MTETVYRWMTSIASYYLVYSIVMNLVADRQYQLYIKSFMGMILIVMVISPFIQVFHSDFNLDDVFFQKDMKRKWDDLQFELEKTEEKTYDYIVNACKETMEAQIVKMADLVGVHVRNVQITIHTDMNIGMIALTVEPYKETKQIEALKKNICDVYEIDHEHISINIR